MIHKLSVEPLPFQKLGLFILLVAWLFSSSTAKADRDEEIEAAQTLVDLVGSDDIEDLKSADEHFNKIPVTSNLKHAAAHALAIIRIREDRFKDAWKILDENSKTATTPWLKLSQEKLFLWLALEAESRDLSEERYKQLVRFALRKDLGDKDQSDVYEFLGGVSGLSQLAGVDSTVPQATLDQGRDGLKNSTTNKHATSSFDDSQKKAMEWGTELKRQVVLWEKGGAATAQVKLDELIQLRQKAESELDLEINNVKQSRKEHQDSLKQNASSLGQVKANIRSIIAASNRPTPDFPVPPRQPVRPIEPIRKFKTDPTTGKQIEEVYENNRSYERYESDMRRYEKDRAEYTGEIKRYEARLAQWKQADIARRQTLGANKQAADQEEATIIKDNRDRRVAMNEIGKGTAELRKKLARIKHDVTIGEIAVENLKGDGSTKRSLFRPSNFEIIDFSNEASRLQQLVTEDSKN